MAYVFSLILIGWPGAAGAFSLGRGLDGRELGVGGSLVAYAILLTLFLVFFSPVGRFSGVPYIVVAPLILIISLVVGGLAGLLQRRRNRS